MRRRGIVLALGAALLALAPAGSHAGESKCQRLDATHDLAPAAKVKLVEREFVDPDTGSTGTKLVGCVLPKGKLVEVAVREEVGNTSTDYDLRDVAGHYALVRVRTDTAQYRSRQTLVVDLKQGDRYTIATRCTDAGVQGDFCPSDEGDTARRAFVNSNGQAAAVVWSASSDLASVEGFSSTGRRVVLDDGTRSEIPASSLELNGRSASWTNDGAHKSAPLPRRTACEKLKAGHDRAPAPDVKLVKRRNDDEGTDLVGCVLPAGRVTVVASSGKESGLERSYKVRQVAGHQVLVRGDVINPYGHGVSTYVYDIKRARSYTVAETCFHDTGAPCEPQTMAKRAFVNRQGQAAAIVATEGSSTVRVVGFRSTGERVVLDSGGARAIPVSSLVLDGHVVRWTHSGMPRSATLSG